MVGRRARVHSPLDPEGTVVAEDEVWSAESVAGSVEEGADVEVIGSRGLTLLVRPAAPADPPEARRSAP